MLFEEHKIKIVNSLITKFSPLFIILYGSYVTSNATNYNDIDILMVMPDGVDRLLTMLQARLCINYSFPIDFNIITKTDFENAKAIKIEEEEAYTIMTKAERLITPLKVYAKILKHIEQDRAVVLYNSENK